jgi:divalent metal cation (Fe/Co/Zn/Cd) transporter
VALVADGKHVMSDFWTSAGVVAGLVMVRLTGLVWLDPVTALLVALNLGRTGYKLVREAAGALLDQEDTALLAVLVRAFDASRDPGIIRIHRLRAIRAGRFTHVDAHLIVPEYWSVEQAHDVVDAFEARVLAGCEVEGEIAFHVDPCFRALCEVCEVAECPVRVRPFVSRPPLTVEEAVLSDEAFWQQEPGSDATIGSDDGVDRAKASSGRGMG